MDGSLHKAMFLVEFDVLNLITHNLYTEYFFTSAVQKDTSCDKEWVCFGNMFLKLSRAQTRTLLKKGAHVYYGYLRHLFQLCWLHVIFF